MKQTALEVVVDKFNELRGKPEEFAHWFYNNADLLLELEQDHIEDVIAGVNFTHALNKLDNLNLKGK